MALYEERLAKDVRKIRDQVARVGSSVEAALKSSVHATLSLDRSVAYRTVLGDLDINRQTREIDRKCHRFVARHLPSAGHLRFVSSVLRMNVALERVGDYAVAISREAVQLSAPPPATVARDIDLLSDQNRGMLNQAMRAFNEANAELARGTMGMAGQLATTFNRVFTDLLGEGETQGRPMRDLFAQLVIFNRLGRVGDQAKNICEETLFTVTGETKKPKVYRILFIDERNDCASQMAEAFARKAFPDQGRYSSAGWDARPELDDTFRQFMDDHGYDMSTAATQSLDRLAENLDEFHVIVSLDGSARERLGRIPFHTVLQDWELPAVEPGANEERLEAVEREIAVRMQELMETLHGDGAA